MKDLMTKFITIVLRKRAHYGLSAHPPVLPGFPMMFYPLSGFIADICCGRLKTVVVSLVFILSCWIFVLIGVAVLETIPGPFNLAIRHNQGIFDVLAIFH